MDYSQTAGIAANTVSDNAYLDRITPIADETELCASLVEQFIDRCRGVGPEPGKPGPQPVPSGHFGQIERMATATERLSQLVRELRSIG